MDEQQLRLQAINIANQRAKEGATMADILAEANTALQWLKTGASAPNTPQQHESQAAVAGQAPRA